MVYSNLLLSREGTAIKKNLDDTFSKRYLGKNLLSVRTQLLLIALALILLSSLAGLREEQEMNHTGLLETIAKGESSGNYNAYYGNAKNTTINFTTMTVDEVLAWQNDFVKKGSPSSAVGKYQFIRPTLNGLVNELKVDKKARFDEKLQDRLAIALLQRRGVNEYANGKISREQFAHNLSKEWAALPRVIGKDPHASYYAGDGLNKVRVNIEEINRGIDTLHQPE